MCPASPFKSDFDVAKTVAAVALTMLGLGIIKLGGPRRAGEFGLIGGIVVIVGLVLALVVIGRYVLGPLDSEARYRRRPTQFTIADFLALVFLFQLPVALIRLAVPSEAPQMRFLYIFAWTASTLMWALSVQTLSRAGVATPWRRVVFLSAVLPIAYFGSVVFIGAGLLAVSAVMFDAALAEMRGFWWYIAIGAALPAAFFWAARFVRGMVAESQADETLTAALLVEPAKNADAPD